MNNTENISINSKVNDLTQKISGALLACSPYNDYSVASEQSRSTAHDLVNNAVEISFPLADFAESGLISVDGDWTSGSGDTVKAANVVISPKKFVQALVKAGIATVAIVHAPDTGILLFADLIYSLYDIARVELDRIEVVVIYAMAYDVSTDEPVSTIEIQEKVNRLLTDHSGGEVSEREILLALKRLEKLRCITLIGTDNQEWCLRETVKTNNESSQMN